MNVHRVTIKTEIGSGVTIEHSFEYLHETEEEAREAGERAALLTQAFTLGYAAADLS